MKRTMFGILVALWGGSLWGSAPVFGATSDPENPSLQKTTYPFAIKGADTLYLDRYEDPTMDTERPCLIFMFGGGFFTGERDGEGAVPFFHFLVQQGYTVIAPDYRLRLKNIQGRKLDLTVDQVGTLLLEAQQMATEDLFDATRYVLDSATAWQIDPKQILTCGSSAGAITVLNGAYQIANQTDIAIDRLPSDFNYAGVISMAGAIMTEHEVVTWKRNPAPLLMFHGDADELVPYGERRLEQFINCGSVAIAGQLAERKSPYMLYFAKNRNHEMAGVPMYEYREVMLDFVQRFVREHQPLMVEIQEDRAGRPELRKDYEWRENIKLCFGPILKEE